MKRLLLLLCVAFAGCGAKSNEEIAKDLITENLKATLPDFSAYSSVNFGRMGKAFLPYEETAGCIANLKAINTYKDSIAVLEKLIKENKTAPTSGINYKEKLEQLQDSTKVISERNNAIRQSYTPETLFKITHDYTLKDKLGLENKAEAEFYFDKDLKKVVKVHKVY